MNYTGGNMNRRYSLLEVSGGAHRLRPRSSSTSVVTVTEASPELRSVIGERRPPATPSATPCFVSPRLAFSTQFSYDSPIQVLTCSSSSVLKPVSKWTSRFSPSSRKGLLIPVLITLCIVGYLLMGGKDSGKDSVPPSTGKQDSVPPGVTQPHCDAQQPGADCGGAHPVTSPLQKFLKEASTREHSHTDQHRTEEEDGGSNITTDGQEERNYRPRIPTVQGQYEGDNDQEHLGSGPLSTVNATQRGDGTYNQKTLSSENLQAVQEGLARAKRSFMSEGREMPQPNQGDIHLQSMRVVEGEAGTSQYEGDRYPQPQYDTHRQLSPQYEAHGQFQPQYDASGQPQPNFEANIQPQPIYEANGQPQLRYDSNRPLQLQQNSIRQPQNSPEDLSQQYTPEEARQSHPRQFPLHQDTLQQPQSLTEDSQRQQQTLDQLYIQHMNLERNNYHREQQIVEKEIEHREMLRRRQQEELWQDQRRQTHNRSPQEQHRTPQKHERMSQNQQRTLGNRLEQWEPGRSHHEETPNREELIPYDERHPAWRDQRLPRGVNPKRYYIRNDL